MDEVGASAGVAAGREPRIDVLEPGRGRPQHRQLESAISLSPLYVFTRLAVTALHHFSYVLNGARLKGFSIG